MSIRADERSLGEQDFQVNQIIVDLDFANIDVIDQDCLRLVINSEVHLRLHLHLLALSFVFSVLKVIKLHILLFAFFSWSVGLVNFLKLFLDFLEEDSPAKNNNYE